MSNTAIDQVLLDMTIIERARNIASECHLRFYFYRIVWQEDKRGWYADIEFHNKGQIDGVNATSPSRLDVRKQLLKELDKMEARYEKG